MTTPWPFPDPPDTPVVTTTHVTLHGLPVLYASREVDDEGEMTWQFHHDVHEFDFADAELVRLDTLFALDPALAELADLTAGFSATREAPGSPWLRRRETI